MYSPLLFKSALEAVLLTDVVTGKSKLRKKDDANIEEMKVDVAPTASAEFFGNHAVTPLVQMSFSLVPYLGAQVASYVAVRSARIAATGIAELLVTKAAIQSTEWIARATILGVAQHVAATVAAKALTTLSTALSGANWVLMAFQLAGMIYDIIDPKGFNAMLIDKKGVLMAIKGTLKVGEKAIQDVAAGIYPMEVSPDHWIEIDITNKTTLEYYMKCISEYIQALKVNSRGEYIQNKASARLAVRTKDLIPANFEELVIQQFEHKLKQHEEGKERLKSFTENWLIGLGLTTATVYAAGYVSRSLDANWDLYHIDSDMEKFEIKRMKR